MIRRPGIHGAGMVSISGQGYIYIPGAAGNGLLNNLIAYWPGDEANGNLIDAHTNGLDLTDTNTVTASAGKVYATARQYTAANDEQHTRASEALIQAGDVEFTIASWCYLDTNTADMSMCEKWVNDEEYILFYSNGNNRFRYGYGDGAAAVGALNADTLGAPATSTWYLVIAWHDPTANTVNIQVNNGGADSAATSGAGGTGASNLTISGFPDPGGTRFWNGRIGPTAIWKSAAGGGGVLTAAQRTALYNSGNGLAYASFTS